MPFDFHITFVKENFSFWHISLQRKFLIYLVSLDCICRTLLKHQHRQQGGTLQQRKGQRYKNPANTCMRCACVCVSMHVCIRVHGISHTLACILLHATTMHRATRAVNAKQIWCITSFTPTLLHRQHMPPSWRQMQFIPASSVNNQLTSTNPCQAPANAATNNTCQRHWRLCHRQLRSTAKSNTHTYKHIYIQACGCMVWSHISEHMCMYV